jgi:RNA polymerase sigma factor for flagellar operon FliA
MEGNHMNIENLWINYSETKDKEIKKRLIVYYVSLVKIVAGRMYNFYGSKIEYDDLLGYGILGLIDSIDKFDITKNIKFETYAQIRIKGAIIDNIRKLDWIPRSLRKKSKELQNAIFLLENRLGRTPNNDEISEHLNIPVKELELLMSDMSTFNVSSLEDFLISGGDYSNNISQDTSTPEGAFEKKEIERLLANSIDSLSKNEKTVISLYYYDELTYKEIGHVMELSESRISQIHSKSILKIRNSLEKNGVGKRL